MGKGKEVVVDADGFFFTGKGRFFVYVLPCGRRVRVDIEWKHFSLPFLGCHDFCPLGLDIYDCEVCLRAYEEDEREADKERWAV